MSKVLPEIIEDRNNGKLFQGIELKITELQNNNND